MGENMKNTKRRKEAPASPARRAAGFFIFLLILFSDCQSFQKDRMINPADEELSRDLAELEKAVIAQDASNPSREDLAALRGRIETLKAAIPDGDFQSQLAAWSGRLYLIEGKPGDAQREYRNSRNLSPWNTPQAVLSFKLERDLQKRLALVDEAIRNESDAGEFQLERGRVLLDLNRFSEAVAAFDSAFILLEKKPFYEDAYKPYRDKAWELRDLRAEGSRTTEIVKQGELTWRSLIEITHNETDLLRFLTAGRDWPAEDIFPRLLERSFIPYTQDIEIIDWPQTKPVLNESVSRAGAAWFLWRLYAENRANRGLLTQYSSRYANTRGARSPIPDLPLLSPFFDSILGTVEAEFMSLPDGRNFIPREKFRASEYLLALRKLADRI
jgi:tetratricopeptide (TPR) repeat protein